MNSETRDVLQEWEARRRERRAWEAANPELAAAWSAALAEDHEREQAAEKRAAEMAALARLPQLASTLGVPRRCVDALTSPRETPSLAAVMGFRSAEAAFLLLLGGAGSGKSVAASWAVCERLRDLLRRNHHAEAWRAGARFVRAGELARIAIQDFDEDSREEFERWCSVSLLVVDDLGTERAEDRWLSRFDELVDRRYGDRLKTIITSNLDGVAFKARYGERVADRIRHDGRIVSSGKESLRRNEVR